jgi:hypothetical protein
MGSGNVVILKKRVAGIEDSLIWSTSSKISMLSKSEGSRQAGGVYQSGSSMLR